LIALVTLGIGGFIFSVPSIVLGFLGRKKEPAAKGMWLTGLMTGFAGILLSIGLLIGLIIVVVVARESSYSGGSFF